MVPPLSEDNDAKTQTSHIRRALTVSQYRLAKEIGVPALRIGDIVAGKRTITADTVLRLCRFFGLSNGYWLRAQAAYDIEVSFKAGRSRILRAWLTVSRTPSVGDSVLGGAAAITTNQISTISHCIVKDPSPTHGRSPQAHPPTP